MTNKKMNDPKTIQERYKAGEKLSRKEMIEVVRWRIVYGIIIDRVCRNVGHTHLNLNPCGEGGPVRSADHISHFNTWWRWERAEPGDRKGTPAKHGYYDFLVAHLEAKGLDVWTRKNCPEIVFKKLDADNWTGHESGAREEQFRLENIKTTKNVQPGGTGKGRERGISGNKPFGNVTWDKTNKTFKAQWTPVADESQKYLLGSCSKDIKTTHDLLLAKWDEVKEDLKGMIPPKSLAHYKDHFVNAYPDDHSLFNWIE